MVSSEILTEHHKYVPILVKDDNIEVLPNELLNWALVPIFWNLFTGLMFLGSKFERSNSLQEGMLDGPSGLGWKQWEVFSCSYKSLGKSVEC